MSQIWYSSEICGTIIVQCIPILRPIVREFQTSRGSSKTRTYPTKISNPQPLSGTMESTFNPTPAIDKHNGTHIALREFSKEPVESRPRSSMSSSGSEFEPRPRTASLPETFLQSDSEDSDLNVVSHSRNISGNERPRSVVSTVDLDIEAAPTRGLSLPRTREDV